MKKVLLRVVLPFALIAQGTPNCVPTNIVSSLDQDQSETAWGG